MPSYYYGTQAGKYVVIEGCWWEAVLQPLLKTRVRLHSNAGARVRATTKDDGHETHEKTRNIIFYFRVISWVSWQRIRLNKIKSVLGSDRLLFSRRPRLSDLIVSHMTRKNEFSFFRE
jgi:hypothetical protein